MAKRKRDVDNVDFGGEEVGGGSDDGGEIVGGYGGGDDGGAEDVNQAQEIVGQVNQEAAIDVDLSPPISPAPVIPSPPHSPNPAIIPPPVPIIEEIFRKQISKSEIGYKNLHLPDHGFKKLVLLELLDTNGFDENGIQEINLPVQFGEFTFDWWVAEKIVNDSVDRYYIKGDGWLAFVEKAGVLRRGTVILRHSNANGGELLVQYVPPVVAG